MSLDARPDWMCPPAYNDEPASAGPVVDVEDEPINYERRADPEAVFGDDLDDDEEEGGVDQ